MTLNVSEVNGLYKKNINFKSEIREEIKENKPEQEEEKSFYERNKKALIALGAIGAAAIAIATHHCIKNKHTEKLSDAASDAAKDARHKVNEASDKMTRKAENTLEEFKDKLNKLADNEDATVHIKSILSSDNHKLRLEAVQKLLENDGKHISANNWEDIFNSLIEIKPSENIKSESITSNINELYQIIVKKEIVTPEVIDKIVTKLPTASDDVKLNLAERLIDNIFDTKGNTIQPELSLEQSKKIMNILDNVNQETYTFYPGGIIGYKNHSLSGLKYQYSSKYFTEQKVDENYIKEIKGLLEKNSLTDEAKLQLSDDIYMAKFCGEGKEKSKESIQLIKELLNSFEGNKAEKYSKPNAIISFNRDKFSLGCRLFSHADIYDDYKVFTTAEKLKIVQNLKEMSKNVKVSTDMLGGNAHYINDIYRSELGLKSKNFFENISDSISFEDYEKFTDEMLNGYEEALNHFIKGDELFEKLDADLLKQKFELFALDSYLNLTLEQLKYIFEPEKAAKFKNISEKIADFGKKHFDIGSSGKSGGSSKSNFAQDFVNNKTKEAKSTISEFLRKDKDLEELANAFDNDKLDEKTLKNIKRRFAVKYHPDKAKDDNQRAEFTKIFQDINNAIEILEKTIKK